VWEIVEFLNVKAGDIYGDIYNKCVQSIAFLSGSSAANASALAAASRKADCSVLLAATRHLARSVCPTCLLFRVESKMRCCANIFICKTVLLNTVFYAERANMPSACLSCIQSSTKPNTQQKYLNPFIRQISPFVCFIFFTINTERLTEKYLRKI
jgi:hypothetical protein